MAKSGKIGRPKGIRNHQYSATFKTQVVESMLTEKIGYREAARRFLPSLSEGSAASLITKWEKIFIEFGHEGFTSERRGRKHHV